MTDFSVDVEQRAAESARATVDDVCAAAVDLARDAAVELAGEASVGGHVAAEPEGERIVTHHFECNDRGYAGWRWAVTVTRIARSKQVTVDEVVLLPGPGALLAPPWVPWTERLQVGDLGVGDLLPTAADDPRLDPGFASVVADDDDDDAREALGAVVDELWLGRPRVLSWYGRDDAAQRWYDGEHGPDAPIARAAELSCSTCGFLAPMRGTLGRVFGVCANELAPDDGRVVSFDHGCGAHSEVLVVHNVPRADAEAVDLSEAAPDEHAEPPAVVLHEPDTVAEPLEITPAAGVEGVAIVESAGDADLL